MDVTAEFRLTTDQARAILGQISAATHGWRKDGGAAGGGGRGGLRSTALDQMAPAFEHEQATRARQLAGW